jgi:hypothetical protein
MFNITRIKYIYEDNSRDIEKPSYLSCGTKEQVEALRKLLIEQRNCKDVTFIYEEC